MPRDLLEFTDGLRIATTRTNCRCTYSKQRIRQGTKALLLRRHPYDDGELNTDKTYSTWVSQEHRSAFEETLADFDFHTAESGDTVVGNISVSTVKGTTMACGMCQNHIPRGTDAVTFRNYTNKSHPSIVWIHKKCIPILCGGLGDLDDYKGEIVTQNI